MRPVGNSALSAAVRLFGLERGHALLGCGWGTVIALPDDREICIRQARQIVVLYGPGGAVCDVKLCLEHAAMVERETDPHDQREGGTRA